MCFFYVSLFWKALEKKKWEKSLNCHCLYGDSTRNQHYMIPLELQRRLLSYHPTFQSKLQGTDQMKALCNISQIYHICIYTQILWNAIAWGKGSFLKAFIYTACIACTALLREDSWVSSSKFRYVPGEK